MSFDKKGGFYSTKTSKDENILWFRRWSLKTAQVLWKLCILVVITIVFHVSMWASCPRSAFLSWRLRLRRNERPKSRLWCSYVKAKQCLVPHYCVRLNKTSLGNEKCVLIFLAFSSKKMWQKRVLKCLEARSCLLDTSGSVGFMVLTEIQLAVIKWRKPWLRAHRFWHF